ncbi:hypothetical protein D3C80_1276070 [compost metagenome]
MQSIIFAVNTFRENHYIFIVWMENNALPFKMYKILRVNKRHDYPAFGRSSICDIIAILQLGNPRVFHPERLIFGRRLNGRLRTYLKRDAVLAAGYSQMGDRSEIVLCWCLDYTRIRKVILGGIRNLSYYNAILF